MTFYEVITAAIADITAHGYDSQQRLDLWADRIKAAAIASLIPTDKLHTMLDAALNGVYRRMVEKEGVLSMNPGASRFTLERVKPKLRAELDRRIMASAQLIKLNREQMVARTLQRFQGWATSIPAGGSRTVDKSEVKTDVRKSLANLSVRDPEHQQYRQAAEQWIRAFLRKESGAAIAPDEFKRDFVVYFPQPGDKGDVLNQKERARHDVMMAFYNEGAPLLSKTNPKISERLNRFAPTTEITPPPQAAPAPQPGPQYAPPQPQSGPQEPPQEAIKYLHQNPTPDMIRAFEQKYRLRPGEVKRYMRLE